ncbi:spermidine synthase [Corynebacterium mustelae]|nr:fused MFS/spermidine synthase [Corynebacterium mustelae]
MGRKRGKQQHSASKSRRETTGTQPCAGIYETSTGTVELRPDAYRSGAWEILVNGVPSSHISDNPAQLDYEYMRWISIGVSAFIDNNLDPDRLRITHLGGGACTLAWHFADRYPSSRNTVVEIDAKLATLVRDWFPIPAAPRVKIRVGDARTVLESVQPNSRDVIIRDVFSGAITPHSLTTIQFARMAARALAANGLYVANCGDHKELTVARSELMTLAKVFPHVAAIADPPMFKGRRYGNIILLASTLPLPTSGDAMAAALTRQLLGGAVPAQYKDEAEVREFMQGGTVLVDV